MSTTEYPGKRACRVLLEQGRHESMATGHNWEITFTNVDERVFRTAFLESHDHDRLFYNWKEYNHSTRSLTIVMTSGAHASVAASSDRLIFSKLTPMDRLDERLYPLGSRACTLEMPDGTRVTRKPDQAWMLINPKRQNGPIAVLEVEYSESHRDELRSDVKKWLSATNHNVQFAMTISITPTYRNLTFQSWQLVKGGNIECTQSIQLERSTGKPIKVSGNQSFKIPFNKLFLREPEGNEGDLIVTRDDLKTDAQSLWQVTDREVPGLESHMADSS